MEKKRIYSIKYVADQTGIAPHLIRTWESRYNAVRPERTETNRRVYCKNDILRLRLLKGAVDAGHQISRIAGESTTDLRDLLGLTDDRTPKPSPRQDNANCDTRSAEHYLELAIESTVNLNPDKLTQILSDAAIHLTRRGWVEHLMVPLFRKIGDLWASGRMKIVNEHLASNCARNILWDMLRTVEITSGAPKIVIGTPVGQWHELGALAAALAAVEAGWRPIYVGSNLPAEELASAVAQFGASCIGLSITHNLNDTRLKPELIKLRRFTGPDFAILVGGLGSAAWDHLLEHINARRVESWGDMTKSLDFYSLVH